MDLQGTNSRRGCLGLCANMLTTNIGSEKSNPPFGLSKMLSLKGYLVKVTPVSGNK